MTALKVQLTTMPNLFKNGCVCVCVCTHIHGLFFTYAPQGLDMGLISIDYLFSLDEKNELISGGTQGVSAQNGGRNQHPFFFLQTLLALLQLTQ